MLQRAGVLFLTCALLFFAGADLHAAAPAHRHTHQPRTAATTQLIAQGEAALRAGDAVQALRAFEAAASQEHEADIEMGIVRALMQAGAYGNALSFAAHTRGIHPEVIEGAALHAWLLALGGQRDYALRVLSETEARFPGHRVIAETRAQLLSSTPSVPSQLRAAPARAAPYAIPSPGGDGRTEGGRLPGEDARERMAASAVLIDGGRRALTVDLDGAGVAASASIRVRNGFGQAVTAVIERRIPALGLTVLILDRPLAMPAGSGVTAERDPFPGSPAVAVHHVTGADTSPAWPWARHGFLGRPLAEGGQRALGFDLLPGQRGGPVLDAAGRLVGITVPTPSGPPAMLPITLLRGELGALLGPSAAAGTLPQLPGDDVYAGALAITLQVLVGQ